MATMTTSKIEQIYNLSNGSVRRDIHRGKIRAVKSGAFWLVDSTEVERKYGSAPELKGFYVMQKDTWGDTVALESEDEIETMVQHFVPEWGTFAELKERFMNDVEWFDFDDLVEYSELEHLAKQLQGSSKRIHALIEKALQQTEQA